MRDSYVTKNIRNVDPAIRAAVIEDALARRITLSDVVGEALSEAWDIAYTLSGEEAGRFPASETAQFNVRIPQEMATRIWLVARANGSTESSTVQGVLATKYGIEYELVKRGGERRRASA